MSRPNFITDEDIARWSKEIDENSNMPRDLIKSAVVREICYSGLWLTEELKKLQCPDALIVRIQYSAGKSSFGKKDVWEIHQNYLKGYQDGNLDFEPEPGIATN